MRRPELPGTSWRQAVSPTIAARRAEERKRIEKQKLGITVRHRILAAVLERAAAPIKKADLLLIAQYVTGTVPYNRVPVLAKRHKIEAEKNGTSPHELSRSTYRRSTKPAFAGCCWRSA